MSASRLRAEPSTNTSVTRRWLSGGAPDAQSDRAARACRAALAIKRKMEAEAETNAGPDLRVKISLHTGPLIVGNIGAPGRINYTVVGDTVNTGSRIEDLCDSVDDGARAIILVSDQIVAEAGDGFTFTPVGSFTVKGKSKPVEVFRLVGEDPAATDTVPAATVATALQD
ncbi:adenylate/guanylate cyclase domain-containing protein [Hoeflea sp.]|uniref:adenylate/guanylate cyclase domain-containing protein n=1 Tax=Hoeflea sp. TaxID=1940281 RepID=UPI003B02D29E